MENLKTNPASLNPENPCGTSVYGGGRNLLINKTKRPLRAKAHTFFGAFKAFTLAEVLVTLTILGILASIIVPSVVQRYQDRQTVTAVKRAYSLVDNALNQMFITDGFVDTWNDIPKTAGDYDANYSSYFMDKIIPYLPVKKICDKNNGDFGCFAKDTKYLLLKGKEQSYLYSVMDAKSVLLKNGVAIALTLRYFPNTDAFIFNDMGHFGTLYIDINGNKKPNRIGYDLFVFNIGRTGILTTPVHWVYQQQDIARNCSIVLQSDYSHADGSSCGKWIMKHNNMKYKYKDVSAEW